MLYRVIIVEDDPLIREGLCKIIFWEECGLELVGCASNGEQALKLLETVEADICITDIKMPIMDGLTFMRTCNAMKKKIKFVVLSGYSDFELVKDAARIGIENYLLKPVDKEELVQTLVTIVSKLESEQMDTAVVNEGIRIFRENLLYRSIIGEIKYEELMEREAYLGLSISHDYVVGIFRAIELRPASNQMNNREKILLLKKQQELLERSGVGNGVMDMNGNLLMLFPYAESNRHEIESIISKMVRNVERDEKYRSFVAMGITVKSFREVEKSYYSAKTLLENYEICPTANIMWQQGIYLETNISIDYHRKIMELIDEFNLSDKEKALRLWEEISEDLRRIPGMRISTMHAMGLIFLNRIINNMKKFNPNTEYKMLQLQIKISDIYKNDHPAKLSEWMEDMIERVFELSDETVNNYSKNISKIVNYLECNYKKNICIKTVADEFKMNQVYLGRIFRQETGKGFTEYVNLLRIKKAKELLRDTDIPIWKIAEQVGYLNSNYFYTIFKRNEGMTPAAFRQKNGI